MQTVKLNFSDAERLRQLLDLLIDEFAARIISIRISKGQVTAELDQEVDILGYGEEDLLDQLRRVRVFSYSYNGPFSTAVIREIFRGIKGNGLVPCYLLLHPESVLKRTQEWIDMAVSTATESTFFGLKVIENDVLDKESFVIAAGHSPRTTIPNVIMGVKGSINALG
jgi:hypothetical protein